MQAQISNASRFRSTPEETGWLCPMLRAVLRCTRSDSSNSISWRSVNRQNFFGVATMVFQHRSRLLSQRCYKSAIRPEKVVPHTGHVAVPSLWTATFTVC